jgi:hypothetical protein|tara:strand:- start:2406 stop:2819 length:414 start_codon:yes stop_codon:yes gene_type:complete
MEKPDLSPFKVKADIMWAFLDVKNKMSDRYQVDLCNLSPEAIKRIEDAGIEVRKKDDKGFFIVAKSKNYPVKTEMADGSPVDAKVGNGSRGVAWIKPFTYNFRGKDGVSAGINRLIVTDLIEYTGVSAADLEETETL